MIAVCIYKNLYYDEDKKRALTFVSALLFVMAGAEGLEPSTTVLETGMLPLHYAPIYYGGPLGTRTPNRPVMSRLL